MTNEAGLQFEGVPSERALEAQKAKCRLIGCYSNGKIHDGLAYRFVDDFTNTIFQALELMAKEKTND